MLILLWESRRRKRTTSCGLGRRTAIHDKQKRLLRSLLVPIVMLLEDRTLLSTSIILTVAGDGIAGNSGDGGAATAAELRNPSSVAVDAQGNIFIADFEDNVVREVSANTGKISTVAGNGTAGYSGDGGPGTASELNQPMGVAVDDSGHLFIADNGNGRVREVDLATGFITTVAGDGSHNYSGDGGPATDAALGAPSSVAVDASGDLFIADTTNFRIREVSAATGMITTVAGNGQRGYSGDGAQATAAELNNPSGVALDKFGDLFIVDSGNFVIREVNVATGVIATVAGDGHFGDGGFGGPATAAQFDPGGGIAVDAAGDLYIADSFRAVLEVSANSGIITVIAGNGSPGYAGDGGPAISAELKSPRAVAVDTHGDLLIADAGNNVIREISQSSTYVPPLATVLSVSVPKVSIGKTKRFEVIVIHFSEALDSLAAQQLNTFSLVTVPKSKKQKGKTIKLALAGYDSSTSTVTLYARKSFVLNPPIRLTVNAGRLLDAEGRPLDGGVNFVEILGPS